jgi:hypothetical protein
MWLATVPSVIVRRSAMLAFERPSARQIATSCLPDHATRLGVNGMLAKPFDLDELCMIVRQLVFQAQTGGVADGASDGR